MLVNDLAWLQTLYESAVAFGMRKALQTEQGKNEMEARIQQLEAECAEKERQASQGEWGGCVSSLSWSVPHCRCATLTQNPCFTAHQTLILFHSTSQFIGS